MTTSLCPAIVPSGESAKCNRDCSIKRNRNGYRRASRRKYDVRTDQGCRKLYRTSEDVISIVAHRLIGREELIAPIAWFVVGNVEKKFGPNERANEKEVKLAEVPPSRPPSEQSDAGLSRRTGTSRWNRRIKRETRRINSVPQRSLNWGGLCEDHIVMKPSARSKKKNLSKTGKSWLSRNSIRYGLKQTGYWC